MTIEQKIRAAIEAADPAMTCVVIHFPRKYTARTFDRAVRAAGGNNWTRDHPGEAPGEWYRVWF